MASGDTFRIDIRVLVSLVTSSPTDEFQYQSVKATEVPIDQISYY